jgi:predicted DNA-binding protein (MmcQ/YjbR family)
MDIETLRNFTLSFDDVEESTPFGPDVIVYKTNKKMFLLLPINQYPVQFNVKCNEEYALELREKYSCVLPGYHMNKKHWNTIVVDGSLSLQQIKEFIVDSYNLIKNPPKKIKIT